jgi:hypothetical protein
MDINELVLVWVSRDGSIIPIELATVDEIESLIEAD